jgi:hypothetical protein
MLQSLKNTAILVLVILNRAFTSYFSYNKNMSFNCKSYYGLNTSKFEYMGSFLNIIINNIIDSNNYSTIWNIRLELNNDVHVSSMYCYRILKLSTASIIT